MSALISKVEQIDELREYPPILKELARQIDDNPSVESLIQNLNQIEAHLNKLIEN